MTNWTDGGDGLGAQRDGANGTGLEGETGGRPGRYFRLIPDTGPSVNASLVHLTGNNFLCYWRGPVVGVTSAEKGKPRKITSLVPTYYCHAPFSSFP